jgi:hypothetical protein
MGQTHNISNRLLFDLDSDRLGSILVDENFIVVSVSTKPNLDYVVRKVILPRQILMTQFAMKNNTS